MRLSFGEEKKSSGGDPARPHREEPPTPITTVPPPCLLRRWAAMGKNKRDKPLSHEEIWDDSALVQSWDAAVEEYKVRWVSRFHVIYN